MLLLGCFSAWKGLSKGFFLFLVNLPAVSTAFFINPWTSDLQFGNRMIYLKNFQCQFYVHGWTQRLGFSSKWPRSCADIRFLFGVSWTSRGAETISLFGSPASRAVPFPWEAFMDACRNDERTRKSMEFGQAAPERATLACGLFQTEDHEGPADSPRAFYLPLNCLKEFR